MKTQLLSNSSLHTDHAAVLSGV